MRRYGANKKTIILVGAVIEVEIGPKAAALGRRRDFVVPTFDLGGGYMKVVTISIRIVKLHNPEPLCPDKYYVSGEKDYGATTTNTGDTTITYPVFVQVFEAPEPDPLNDEAFRVVVAQSMAETSGSPLSPLT